MKKKYPDFPNYSAFRRRLMLVTGILWLGVTTLIAQNTFQYTGTVSDKTGETLPGVSVVVKGTVNGAATDIQGGYKITSTRSTEILVFSFVGYVTQEIETPAGIPLKVVLASSAVGLSELVVIGYGTQKKSVVTGAINLDAIKSRLNKLQNTQRTTVELWKPAPGKHTIRLVPYKFNKENPFIELYFHYNINNKTYLSPMSFGRPDPIVEFADKLKRMGDKEDWKAAKKMEPKLRTFVPVLVRGEEGEGVKFWGFGKTVYQEILGYMADADYGDITDPNEGRDITVEVVSAEDSGTSYPVTTIRVKPKETPLAVSKEDTDKYLNNQKEITELYSELTYAELKNVLEGWLNPSAASEDEKSASAETLSSTANNDDEAPFDTTPSKPEVTPAKKLDDVASAFDDLFNS